MTHEQRALAKNAQKVQIVLDRYPEGVTMSQITGDTQLSSAAARATLLNMRAECEDGLWFEGAGIEESAQPVDLPSALPTSASACTVCETATEIAPLSLTGECQGCYEDKTDKQWWETQGGTVAVGPEPTPAAPLIKEPRVTVRTRMIAMFEDHPEGITKEDAAAAIGVTVNSFKTSLMELRKDTQVDLIERDGKKLYVMRDDLASAPAPVQEIEMQQPEQVQAVIERPEPTQQPTNLEGWVFIDSTGAFKNAPRESAAQAIEAMERLGNCKVDDLMKSQGLRLAKVRVVTETLFVMGAVA